MNVHLNFKSLSQDEEGLIEHKAGGPFSGFVVKKMLPISLQRTLTLDKCHLSFKLNVFMKRAGNDDDMQHVSLDSIFAAIKFNALFENKNDFIKIGTAYFTILVFDRIH